MSANTNLKLRALLDGGDFFYISCSDTFHYACADCQRYYLDGETNTDMLIEMHRRFGRMGLIALVAHIRKVRPLLPIANTQDYIAAHAFLAASGWTYEDD